MARGAKGMRSSGAKVSQANYVNQSDPPKRVDNPEPTEEEKETQADNGMTPDEAQRTFGHGRRKKKYL